MSDYCKFCGGAELRPDMKLIAEMSGGMLYLMRDQTHPGRMLLASKRHVRKMTELTLEEYTVLMTDGYRAAQAVNKVLNPDKINYLVLGDTGTHLHLHICPKYLQGKDWGKVFLTDETEPQYLAENEFDQRITMICNALKEV